MQSSYDNNSHNNSHILIDLSDNLMFRLDGGIIGNPRLIMLLYYPLVSARNQTWVTDDEIKDVSHIFQQ